MKNLVQPDRPQITINTAQKLQFVSLITKAGILSHVHTGEGNVKVHPKQGYEGPDRQ